MKEKEKEKTMRIRWKEKGDGQSLLFISFKQKGDGQSLLTIFIKQKTNVQIFGKEKIITFGVIRIFHSRNKGERLISPFHFNQTNRRRSIS